MISKTKEIAALEELKGDCTGIIAATIEDCQKVIGDMAEENGWISVTERLPENFVSVLGYMPESMPFPPVRECYMVGDAFFFPALQDTRLVTHWMPLPEPPKEPAHGKRP